MGRPRKALETSAEVKRYLTALLTKMERDEIPVQKGKALSSVAYMILQCIYGEQKAADIEAQESLADELKNLKGGYNTHGC